MFTGCKLRSGLPLFMSVAVLSGAILASAQPGFADGAQSNALSPDGSWSELRTDILGDVQPMDGATIFDIEAPYRAHDAATVPISFRQIAKDAPFIKSAMLVIDENPAPVAAEMTFGEAMYPLDMEVRVRVNQYSNVRLIAETDRGAYMTGRFVKASGGCSAPATKDPELALSTMGQIRAKTLTPRTEGTSQRREAQVMIRHPNYSGLQRDQITQLFITAQFLNHIEVKQGDELLFTVDGGISISENPVFRFAYTDDGSKTFKITAEDTDGNVWEQEIQKDASAS